MLDYIEIKYLSNIDFTRKNNIIKKNQYVSIIQNNILNFIGIEIVINLVNTVISESKMEINNLSKIIFDIKPNANIYLKRNSNPLDIDPPGICIYDEESKIANLTGQLLPGNKIEELCEMENSIWLPQIEESRRKKYILIDDIDSRENRIIWFWNALKDLTRKIPNGSSINFPYKMGYELNDDDWYYYENLINRFAKIYPQFIVKIIIY
jgi:hypothetical protein|uniref:Uncharacterized protein n=1 Tax=viral metagenome TaxID=1070528 RepID=A0A6C0EDH4_9ZZZZ